MDAVILYVNGADPMWQKDYRDVTREPMEASRFRDWGTLPFLFRGIAKYLPFIEKIHLVVSRESQVPGWIDREKVNIVLHKDIIPEQYLPTFNSCVIETHIPYIKDLAEEFIYFNDDMFPINPCEPEMFFRNGRPQEAFREKSIIYSMGKTYHRQCFNSTRWAQEALGIEPGSNFLMPYHWPHPMLKSYCLEILQIQADKYRKQVSALRTKENVNQYLFLDYMYLGGVSDNVEQSRAYIEPSKGIKKVIETISGSEAKVLCFNDNGIQDWDYPIFRKEVCRAFRKKLPEPCKYEKGYVEKADLIVSMTTYPARALYAATVWKSVLSQKTDTPFKCVMVLIEPEWEGQSLPFELQELVDLKQIDILWHKKKIRSHAKLMPVIKKYPEATIITIDDDMIKPEGWLQNLIEDHRRWPEDIISDSFTYYLDSDMRWRRMLNLSQKVARGKNDVPSLVFQFARICSGHGTVFPAHAFKDQRFFDEDEAMRLAPTCDETWMWLFLMLSGRNFRQCSQIYDESAYTLPNTQQMSTTLWRANKNIYDQMYARLFNAYPEFKEELLRRQNLYVMATEETLEEVRQANPYVPAIVGEFSEGLLKKYQDCPNKKIQTNRGILYPPGQ